MSTWTSKPRPFLPPVQLAGNSKGVTKPQSGPIIDPLAANVVLEGRNGDCDRAEGLSYFWCFPLPVKLAGLPKASRSLRLAVTFSPAAIWGFWRFRREAVADGGAGRTVTALGKVSASENEDPTN